RRNGAGLPSRDRGPAPTGDTPRGPGPSAEASGRGSVGPSRLRPGGAAPRKALATIRPPAASRVSDFVHRAASLEKNFRFFGPPAAPFSDGSIAGGRRLVFATTGTTPGVTTVRHW